MADYAFTTLAPQLGVVPSPSPADDPIVVADIPGLIEGAHEVRCGVCSMCTAGEHGIDESMHLHSSHFAASGCRSISSHCRPPALLLIPIPLPCLPWCPPQNRGLGHSFLRHIERTQAIAYVLDCQSGSSGEAGGSGKWVGQAGPGAVVPRTFY